MSIVRKFLQIEEGKTFKRELGGGLLFVWATLSFVLFNETDTGLISALVAPYVTLTGAVFTFAGGAFALDWHAKQGKPAAAAAEIATENPELVGGAETAIAPPPVQLATDLETRASAPEDAAMPAGVMVDKDLD